MPSNIKSQNLSIMMTDIQGYTNASSSSSREEIIGLIRRHNQLMIPVITFYGGTIIKSIGDAFLCTFPSATDAVVCAIIIQLLLREYNNNQKEEGKKMKLRVVINTGDVSIEKNDIYGDAVNITARMEGLECFPGGAIGISESTYLLMNRNEIVTEKIGPQTLKGIPDPVTVYRVPLEKQKLTEIPAKLLQLVEKSMGKPVQGGGPGGGAVMSSAQFNEWNTAVVGFLKEKNWGENIGSLLDEKKIRENVTNVQKQLTATFSQKTVIESKGKSDFNDASMASRIKACAIDAVIFTIIWFAVYYMVWWPAQSLFFGKTQISSTEFESIKENRLKNAKEKFRMISDAMEREFPRRFKGAEIIYVRPQGWAERIISFNMEYPFLLLSLYMAIFWIIKGASPGQIAVRNAVVKDDGSPIDFLTAIKRSVIFTASLAFFFLGVLYIFTESRKTLYDKICGTRVVE